MPFPRSGCSLCGAKMGDFSGCLWSGVWSPSERIDAPAQLTEIDNEVVTISPPEEETFTVTNPPTWAQIMKVIHATNKDGPGTVTINFPPDE